MLRITHFNPCWIKCTYLDKGLKLPEKQINPQSSISIRSSSLFTESHDTQLIGMQQDHRRRGRTYRRESAETAIVGPVVVSPYHRFCLGVYSVWSQPIRRAYFRSVSRFLRRFDLSQTVYMIFSACRCVHITDIGIGYISTMLSLSALYLRWCSQIRDFGLQHLCGMRNLQILSLAGI